jgi:hypothetical protein
MLIGDPRRVVLVIVLAVLAGATAFGLWHLILGGLVNGNPRAAAFGAVLAIGAGGLLAGVVTRTRGWRTRGRERR